MKRWYLLLSVIGFILPNIWVLKVTVETGNLLFWSDVPTTFSQMFVNDIATAFMVDLLFVVLVFFVWSYHQAKKHRIKYLGLVWLLTMLFGIAGGFPLFLYLKELSRERRGSS